MSDILDGVTTVGALEKAVEVNTEVPVKPITDVTVKHKAEKEIIVNYLRKSPFYRHAGWAVGIHEDTLKNWRDEDKEFSARCEASRSECLQGFVRRSSPDFILTHADQETFNKLPKQEIEGNFTFRWNDGNNNTLPSNATPAVAAQLPK